MRSVSSIFSYWIMSSVFSIARTMLTTGDGNAFVLPVTTNGYLDDLMPMPDATAQPVGDSYVVQWRGRSFAPDEVLHFVLHPDLTYPWRGTRRKARTPAHACAG